MIEFDDNNERSKSIIMRTTYNLLITKTVSKV